MRPPPRMRSIRDTIEERTKPDRVPNGRADSESLKLYEAVPDATPCLLSSVGLFLLGQHSRASGFDKLGARSITLAFGQATCDYPRWHAALRLVKAGSYRSPCMS